VHPLSRARDSNVARGRLAERVVGGEDEYLADHVGVLLVARHEADDGAAGGVFDDLFEAGARARLTPASALGSLSVSASRGSFSKTAGRPFAIADHDPDPSPIDDHVLDAVTEAMVALHERYHGRRPKSARTRMMGPDLLACLLGDVYTDIEKTMIELQRHAMVHETRSAFQQAMEHRFIAHIERLTRRRVVRFISTHNVGPDLELELFVLEP
jgi:uncharacterized protein YbcI